MRQLLYAHDAIYTRYITYVIGTREEKSMKIRVEQ